MSGSQEIYIITYDEQNIQNKDIDNFISLILTKLSDLEKKIEWKQSSTLS